MPSQSDCISELRASGTLEIKVSMAGSHRVSQAGNKGFYQSRSFSWLTKLWTIRFQASVRDCETPTTHGRLGETVLRPTGSTKLGLRIPPSLLQEIQAANEARESWKMEKTPDGVQAQFDPNGLRQLKSGKKGSVANFYVGMNGLLYWGQFLLKEKAEPGRRPTERDWAKGARAGIPTLGKRR
jgi:hypothetical protein